MTPLVLLGLAVTFSLPIPLVIQLLISTILPLVVALVTAYVTSATRKALVLLGLSILSSGLTELLGSINAGNPFDFGLWLLTAVGTFVIGVATYFGLWRKTEVRATLQAVGSQPRGTDGRFK